MSIASHLPAPRSVRVNKRKKAAAVAKRAPVSRSNETKRVVIPSYRHRRGWQPKVAEDFADGGAYPEIHVVQFPLGLGSSDQHQQSNAISLKLGGDGKVDYANINRSGHVQSRALDLVPLAERQRVDLERPTDEQEEETAIKTKRAMDEAMGEIVDGKIARHDHSKQQGTLVKYTPVGRPGEITKTRVIRMVETQEDPLEPAKFMHKRAPAGPPSPPVPVLHSPDRKLSKAERDDWVIPPCVSNWKNPKGYTVPLDKRLAADGRGLHETTINDRFASFAESLYLAEQNAREDVARRAQIRREEMIAEQEATQVTLQEMARATRRQQEELQYQVRGEQGTNAEGWQEREKMREEKRRDRERETRMKKMPVGGGSRDVSERIALGDTVPKSRESMYDQRLFNQGAVAARPDIAADDEYSIYEKPLFSQGSTAALLKRQNTDTAYGSQADMDKLMDTSRFKADKGFKGSDQQDDRILRDGPVQFKRAAADEPEDLLAGLDDFLTSAKSKKPKQ